jgi:hypothetical protein
MADLLQLPATSSSPKSSSSSAKSWSLQRCSQAEGRCRDWTGSVDNRSTGQPKKLPCADEHADGREDEQCPCDRLADPARGVPAFADASSSSGGASSVG